MTGNKITSFFRGWLAGLAALVFLLASPVRADDVTVFAAASLKNALDKVVAGFEAETGHKATVSYAGSSALARQIELGAPADVFVSANSDWVDYLEGKGAVRAETRINLLGNQLVLISHTPQAALDWKAIDLATLMDGGRLAMAMVQSVPAGIYGKAAIENLGQWDEIAPLAAQVDNVRAALALVALGETPFGIVYATDALADPRVHIAARIPGDSHPAIQYPAVAITTGDATITLMTYLQGAQAKSIFEKHGFSVLAE